MSDQEYGRDPYLDALKIRLANKFLQESEEAYVYVDEEFQDIKKQIEEYRKEND